MANNVSLTYSFTSEAKEPDRAAIAVILNEENRVLVVQRHGGRTLFPGGGVDFGETDQKAAKREAEEEAGVGIRVVYKVDQQPHPKKPGKTVAYYLCEHEEGEAVNVEPGTHAFVKWVQISEAMEMMGDEMTSSVKAYLGGIDRRHSQYEYR